MQRLRDRQWLEAVFGTPRRAGCPLPPRAPAGPSLGEVRARLRGALRLVRRLRDLGQALREAEADGRPGYCCMPRLRRCAPNWPRDYSC